MCVCVVTYDVEGPGEYVLEGEETNGDDGDAQKRAEGRKKDVADNRRKVWEALALKIEKTNTFSLGEEVTRQIRYRDLGQYGTTASIAQQQIEGLVLRNMCSHFVFCKTKLLCKNLKVLTEDLVPHIAVVISGKDHPSTWSRACATAARGATIMLLKNSGHIVDEMVATVENRKLKQIADRPRSNTHGRAQKKHEPPTGEILASTVLHCPSTARPWRRAGANAALCGSAVLYPAGCS